MVVWGFVIQEEVTSATFVFNSSFDDPISEYNKLKPLLSEDYRLEKNFTFSLKDLVNLSINHLSLYGEEIDLMKNHETLMAMWLLGMEFVNIVIKSNILLVIIKKNIMNLKIKKINH